VLLRLPLRRAVPPLVVRNDALRVGQVQALLADGEVSHIILSPGPGAPDVPADIGEARSWRVCVCV
jgi:anthranilate/para-aminobenzoate synthase component II